MHCTEKQRDAFCYELTNAEISLESVLIIFLSI